MITIIIPANNEARYIRNCLGSLLRATDPGGPLQIIVAANNCSDDTASIARDMEPAFRERGWRLDVLELASGGKIGALNAADALAIYDKRMYVDADVEVSRGLIAEVARALSRNRPTFAAGRVTIPKARSLRGWHRWPSSNSPESRA